jgi:hypothetical protein
MTNLIAELKTEKRIFKSSLMPIQNTFTSPESPDYNEVMAKRAWNHALTFFERIFEIEIRFRY